MNAPRKVPELTGPAEETPLRLLIVDDDANDLELCLRGLRKSGIAMDVVCALTREEFNRKLRAQVFDIVLADYRMRDWTGLDALETVQDVCPNTPLILVSGTLGEELAVDCIKLGVTDYVLKHQLARLPVALRRAKEESALRDAELKATQALRESEERYRTLVENAPEAIVVIDAETKRFVDCNDNALRLFRVTRAELVSRTPADFSPTLQMDGRRSEELAAEQITLAMMGRKPCFDWVHRNSQGDEISCEIHLIALPSAGRPLVRGSILDITERKRAEAALRQSESRYRGLVDNATYGIYWLSSEGNLLFVNPALVQMLGYDSARELMALGTTQSIYVDPTARETILSEYFKNERVETTVEWKRKDGKKIIVRINGRRAQDPVHGKDCIEIIVQDVTERMALEKQLLEAQKFEAIGQLAGGIAHDFNNMIGAIMGWADIGAEETEPDSRLRRHFEKGTPPGAAGGCLNAATAGFRKATDSGAQGHRFEPSGNRNAEPAGKGDWQQYRDQSEPCSGPGHRSGGPDTGGASADESMHQCARRHAEGWGAGDRQQKCFFRR